MAASATRTNWSFLILRLTVGGMALLTGLQPLLHSGLPTTLAQAGYWGVHLGEVLCGIFMLLGLWMTIAGLGLAGIIGWPLLAGWLHGVSPLGNLHGLFLLLVVLASTLGGSGKWSVGRG